MTDVGILESSASACTRERQLVIQRCIFVTVHLGICIQRRRYPSKVKTLLRQIVIPFAAIVLLWLAVVIVISIGLEVAFGHDVEKRFSPFLNVHLMEQASEGSYSPLTDAVFWICAVLVGSLAFGSVGFFVAKRETQPRFWLAVAPSLLAVAALALRFHLIWNESYPSSMRIAFICQLVIYVGCALVGLGLGARSVAGPGQNG